MNAKKTRKVPVQLGDGCAVTDDIVYVSAFPDESESSADLTRLFALNANSDEKWFHHDLVGHQVVSVCLRRATATVPRAVCALSDEGMVEFANSAEQHLEAIPGAGMGAQGARRLGPMRRLREVGGSLYACGGGNQVYKRQPDGWHAMDQQLAEMSRSALTDISDLLHTKKGLLSSNELLALTEQLGEVGGLDDIAGVAQDDLYACGVAGALWHWNGRTWRRLEIPSDEHLHSMHIASDGQVWVCGHNGTLLKGNKERGFRSLLGEKYSDHFWSIREFDGAVYLGSTKGLFSYQGQSLKSVVLPGKQNPSIIQALDATDNVLWVVAQKYVARLRDGIWERFDHPDNLP